MLSECIPVINVERSCRIGIASYKSSLVSPRRYRKSFQSQYENTFEEVIVRSEGSFGGHCRAEMRMITEMDTMQPVSLETAAWTTESLAEQSGTDKAESVAERRHRAL